MPKKGAKAGGKQMTEEERLLYLQQKAQSEAETARRKEEMLAQFLKDKLMKEEQNSKLNQLKLTQQWRAVLRQTRAEELRNDITIFSKTFERVVDQKNNVIKSLLTDLTEAEQQSVLALMAHHQCMDQLLVLQEDKLTELNLEWNANLEELKTKFNTEREQILQQHQVECEYLEDVTFAMEQRYTKMNLEDKQNQRTTYNDIKNQTVEEKHILRIQLEGAMEDLWQQYQKELHSYNEATKEHTKFEALHAADKRSTQEIAQDMKHLQKIQDAISAMRTRLNTSQRENDARDLRKAREEMVHKVHQLKSKLSLTQESERKQLTGLTISSNNTIKKLQDIIEKGEKLLRRAELCRKLETEQEKVLPFYISSLSSEEQSAEREQSMEAPSEELAQAMMDYTSLKRFWERYNKALLDTFSLEQQRMLLEKENQQLRILLKQYLDGISVNNEVLQQRNPLLMMSPISLQAAPDPQSQKHCTVIEAAHLVQHSI